MIDIIPFLFWKVCALLILVVILGWPAIFALYNLLTPIRWLRITLFVFIAMMTVTLWTNVLPFGDTNTPADSAWRAFTRTFKDYLTAEDKVTRTDLEPEIRRYRLDGWRPPKHFYVDITDLTTGKQHLGVYVSKHCNSAGGLRRGDEYNIRLNRYTLSNDPERVRYEFPNLYSTFC